MERFTLGEMESCDFTLPLNVTIVFDESDQDDELYSLYDKQQDLEKHVDSHKHENVGPENYREIASISERNQTRDNKKRKSEEGSDSHTKKKKKKKKDKRTSRNEKCDISSYFFTNINSITETQNCTWSREGKKISYDDKQNEMSSSSISSSSTKSKDNSMPVINPGNNDGHFSNANKVVELNKNEEFNQVPSNMKDLLDTVSENLILSIEAYHQHVKTVNKKSNQQNTNMYIAQLQESKTCFNRWKCHFYQLSYCAVAHVIIPQENNVAFIDKFFNDTINLAKDKMGLDFTRRFIEPFYYEMVAWTKQKKIWMRSARSLVVKNDSGPLATEQSKATENRTPILSKQLAQPPGLPEYVSQQRTSTNRIVISRIPDCSGSLPNKELPMVADPSLQRGSDRELPPFIPFPYDTTHNRQLSTEYPNLQRVCNQDTQNLTILSGGIPENDVRIDVTPDLMKIKSLIHQLPRHPPVQHSKAISYQTKESNNLSSSFGPVSIAQNTNEHLRLNVQVSATNTSVLNSNQNSYHADPHKQYIENHQQRVINPHQQYPTNYNLVYQQQQYLTECNRNQLRAAMPREQNYNAYFNKDQCEQNQRLNQSIELSRSSVSTDSGFVSPLQFNTGPDKRVSSPAENEDQNLTPMITHVTSLNPKAHQIAEGPCHVCGEISKTKCLGCYQVYYCNSHCQRIDWNMHMSFCKKVKETLEARRT